jgi:DNA-binding NarL/FixJ family response regulator
MPSSQPIPVFIVDDHQIVSDLLGERLSKTGDFEVVGHARDAESAIGAVLEHPQTQILLMDIKMPGMDCFEATRELMRRLPELAVVFLSGEAHDCDIEQALSVGARGYLMKDADFGKLHEALLEIARGGESFSEKVVARLARDERGRPIFNGTTKFSGLTPRELEVLKVLARGHSKKEVAQMLSISVKTVEHHTSSLMDKLEIHDRVELARYAIREGLADA